MNLYHGDCLEVLPTFPPASVEAIITDLPYGTTACEWDSIIPLALMWEQVKRVLKPAGVFITTASQPFTSVLVCSNLSMFKYEWIWEKARASGHLDANRKPMKAHESGLVFYETLGTFNPQKVKGSPYKVIGKVATHEIYGKDKPQKNTFYDGDRYPRSVIYLSQGANSEGRYHPTQKPIELYEYFIRTYTNEGDTVLDFCFGSGTTGVAAKRTNRKFIGIEKEQKYFEIGKRRIAQAPQPLFTEPPRQPTQREPDLKLESGKLSGFE